MVSGVILIAAGITSSRDAARSRLSPLPLRLYFGYASQAALAI